MGYLTQCRFEAVTINEAIYQREGKSRSQRGVIELTIIASQTASVDTLNGNLMFASSSQVISKHDRSLKQLDEAPAKGLPRATWELAQARNSTPSYGIQRAKATGYLISFYAAELSSSRAPDLHRSIYPVPCMPKVV